MEILRSVPENTYFMFQPSGPYFRRSLTKAWKKHRPNNNFLNSPDLSIPSMNSSVTTFVYDPIKLARTPFGGSMVILMPFCRMKAGKCGDGSDVSHNRNDSLIRSGDNSSHKRSNVGIQEIQRWQFCKQTQVPLSCASLMAAYAMSPWPWPSDMACNFFPPNPFSSAKAKSADMGSAPGVSTNSRGVKHFESS